MYAYLLINILTILVPFALSFERRIRYVSKWKYWLAASLLSSLIFLPWDFLFTRWGVWGFTRAYVLGIHLGNLPLEEVLFFFTIPFSCLFIYEVVSLFVGEDIFRSFIKRVILTLVICCLIVGVLNSEKIYTFWNFIGLASLLIVHLTLLRSRYMGRFLMSYLISLIPFVIVNGILTRGLSFIDSNPVVWYNNRHNLALRLQGIPVEDFAYWLFLFLLNVTWYEYFKRKGREGG